MRPEDVRRAGVRETLRAILRCDGAPRTTDCILDELQDIIDLDAGGTAFAQSVSDLDPAIASPWRKPP